MGLIHFNENQEALKIHGAIQCNKTPSKNDEHCVNNQRQHVLNVNMAAKKLEHTPRREYARQRAATS